MVNEPASILNLLKLIEWLDFRAISQKKNVVYIYKNIYAKLIFREVVMACTDAVDKGNLFCCKSEVRYHEDSQLV
jgi:hypothetical protein